MMKIIKNVITILLAVVLCQVVLAEKRQQYYLSMKDLTNPESPSYVPYPYPQTKEEIIADLIFQAKRMYSHENIFDYSLVEMIDLLPELIKENSTVEIQEIVKVKNRIARMSEEYSYLIVLYDKKNRYYERVAMRLSGVYMGGAHSSNTHPLKSLKKKSDIVDILSKFHGASFEKESIKKIEIIAYDMSLANPIYPVFRVSIKNGSIYFVDYHDRLYKKADEKTLKGRKDIFIRTEQMKLKKGERYVYDSISDKFIVLTEVHQGLTVR